MEIFSVENLFNLGVLIFLQAVLGFDNLLYISIESQRAPKDKQAAVRKWGIIIAVILRIALLFVMMTLLEKLVDPFFSLDFHGVITGDFNFASLVFIFGGGFLMFTAVKEITHLLGNDDLAHESSPRKKSNAVQVTMMIVLMNLIFSFDSILSAVAITHVFIVLATAIIISGIAMYVLADTVTAFIQNNRKYEVLGLFILLIVGVVLIGDGSHQAHLHLFDYAVEPISKATFYFSMIVLVIVDVLQSKHQKVLARKK